MMPVQRNSRPAPTVEHQAATVARLAEQIPAAPRAALGVGLWRSAVRAVDAYESHLRRYGLSAGRFGLLLTLFGAEEEAVPPSTVAQRVGVSRPTVTNLGQKLVAAGLVDRVSGGLCLSAAGRARMASVAPDHFGRLAAAVDALTEEERATLQAALPVVSRFCEHLLAEEEA